ncbi:MAG: tetratricopeptide repeat protein [Chromatiales bacterium]
MALAPHSGADRADREIDRWQGEAGRAADSVAPLERLGWAYVAKARTSYDLGFYKLAEQTALCLDAKQPQSPEALLLRGHVLHNLHRFMEAETLARELVKTRGLWFDYGLLGDVLMEQGKLDEAVGAYQSMMDQKPGPQAYSRAAHIRWLRGDLAGAIELMQMAAGGGSSRDPESSAWAYVRLARYELQAGHTQKASDQISAALALQPDYAPALLARGELLLAEEKNTEAVTLLRRAAELNPLPEYRWALIEALQAAGRAEEAKGVQGQLMQRGAADDPRTYALYLATVGDNIDTALRLAQQELKVRADVITLDALAWALRTTGNIEAARKYSERALAEGTEDARLFYHAGVIAAASGQNGEAQRWLDKATAIQQMLLPSERAQLAKESAALQSQETGLASDVSVRQEQSPR